MIAIILIQPAFALGPLILSSRYAHQPAQEKQTENSREVEPIHVELPVALVAQALASAKTEGASVVRIEVNIPPGER
jgi:hypothetical protein